MSATSGTSAVWTCRISTGDPSRSVSVVPRAPARQPTGAPAWRVAGGQDPVCPRLLSLASGLRPVHACSLRGIISLGLALCGAAARTDPDTVDGVVGVAKWIPGRPAGLGSPGGVGGPGPDADAAWHLQPGQQLPRIPAVRMPRIGERGPLPGLAAEAHLDAGDGRRTRPGQAADHDLARLGRVPRP